MPPQTRSQSRRIRTDCISKSSAIKLPQSLSNNKGDKQFKRKSQPFKRTNHKMMSIAPAMIDQHSIYVPSLTEEFNASPSSSRSMIGTSRQIQQQFVATIIPTSPASLSPSSLFDDDQDLDDEDDFNDGKIRGWLSETSRHLSSSEIPSSRSTKKKINQITWSPWTKMGMNTTTIPNVVNTFDTLEDEDADESSNKMPISPTLEITQNRQQDQNAKTRVRRIRSLPHRSSVSSWRAISESSRESHIGLRNRNSIGDIKTTELAGPSRQSQGNVNVIGNSSSSVSSRPATPSSSARRRGLKTDAPFRPQSAMKHKSANEYSSGKNVPTIVVSSGGLPYSKEGFEEEENSLISADRMNANQSLTSLKRQRESINKSPLQAKSDLIPSSPTPMSMPAPAISNIESMKKKVIKKSQVQPYILHSRASLPKNSFYQRTKQEEGSPTPVKRIKSFPSFM